MSKHTRKGANSRARKTSHKSLHLPRGLMLVVLCAGVVIGGIPWLMNRISRTTYFPVKKIIIDADSTLHKDKVLAVSGLYPGMKMTEVKPNEVRQRIEAMLWVKSARITRILPGTVKVHIVTRKPIAYLGLETVYWIDEDGAVLPLSRRQAMRIPLLFGLSDTVTDSTGRVRLSSESIQRVRAFQSEIKQFDRTMPDRISQVDFSKKGDVAFSLADGYEVNVAELDLSAGLKRLDRLMNVVQNEQDSVRRHHINLCRNNLAYVW
jgi:cell division septal protein FtsQ